MFGTVVPEDVVDGQDQLQPKVKFDDAPEVEDGVLAAKGEGDRLQGVLLVASWEDHFEDVGQEGQLEVGVALQDRVDVEVDGVLPYPGEAHHLQQHDEGHHLVVPLAVGNHQLEHQQQHAEENENDPFNFKVKVHAEDLEEGLLENGVGEGVAGCGGLVEQSVGRDQGSGWEVYDYLCH